LNFCEGRIEYDQGPALSHTNDGVRENVFRIQGKELGRILIFISVKA
jgi:hypothetical protein